MDFCADNFISVVVPARNVERYVRRTLESVVSQTHKALEIIVVDDGSTDETAAIVMQMAQQEPRIRLIRTQRTGVSAARNLAINAARGDLIATLDADDVWHPEKLARQLAVMRNSGPNVGLVYCWSAGIDDHDLVILPAWTRSVAVGDVLRDIVVTGIVGNGSTPLIRRKYIEAVGGYDVDLALCEDWKFYTALAGVCEFAVIPECLIGYRIRSDSASMSVRPMEKAIGEVTAWIVKTWPWLPKSVLLDREYTVNAYLAFLAIRGGQYGEALRYLKRAYVARPGKLLGVCPVQFYLLFVGHLIGIRDYRWTFWQKPIRYSEIKLSELATSARAINVPEGDADKGVQQQGVEAKGFRPVSGITAIPH
jgi:glycosyltransferase involved in cell wall biosynthesis